MAPRVWLITGASSGLGLELAKVVACRGDKVIATSRAPEKLAALKQHGIEFAFLDQNEPLAMIQVAMNGIIANHGTIDVVVNNAAYVQTGTVEEATTEEVMRQFQANAFGPVNIYRAILPHMRANGQGVLMTIGSMAAWYPMPSCNLYNASKAALRWLTLGLADEIKQFGILHCLVEPGFFRTDLLKPGANLSITSANTRIPAYAELNATADASFEDFHGAQIGDPVKGAEILYDVATSTGCAAGRELPAFLPLGSDASEAIGKSAKQTLNAINEWRSISAKSDFIQGQ